MRLRLTVRRHRLPDTLVIWAIDTSSKPTIFHLLEQVNETIPIESDGEWGLDDYAVEVKGNSGVNYECLHFQHLASVIKDEDEVIIRPLLTQDIKIRRVSGRVQISADGKHLVDGVAWGRPLLRKAGDRPAVNIPPRKRQRIEYNEDDEDTEGFQALREKETEDSEEDNNRQLVLHADFDDDDEEDDDDFAPGEGEDAEEDDESEEDLKGDDDEEEAENKEENPADSHSNGEDTGDASESALADVKDQATRAKIRKLHSVFPKSPLAVCKYVFIGSEDIGEAYEAMARGFIPEKPKSAVTEISQGVEQSKLSVSKIRSKAKTPSVHEPENLNSMQVELDENALIDYYDQNGLPEGSIKSGKALLFMAEALKSSPARSRSEPKRSASVISNKSVRFSLDGSFSKGLTSTPFIDNESQVEEEGESEEDSHDESEGSNEEDASSSEDSSDSSDEEVEEVKASDDGTSSSESDSESSSDSSSDGESPEEASSRQVDTATAPAKLDNAPSSQDKKPNTFPTVRPGQGTSQTRTRNKRRRNTNTLSRFKKNGVLPAGTTLADFKELEVDEHTSAENALAALEAVRAAREARRSSEIPDQSPGQDPEFQRRREELLASLAAGGVEVDPKFLRNVEKLPAAESTPDVEMTDVEVTMEEFLEAQQSVEVQNCVDLERESPESTEGRQIVESKVTVESQEVVYPLSTSVGYIKHTSVSLQSDGVEVEMARPSTAPETAAVDTSLTSPKPPPACMESSQPSSSRRAKLDLGAGRRLLFGALGRKLPKTKADEEKIRNDIMKNVRPLPPKKTNEESHSRPANETADEDPDAWRQKINYQAKECVQDGVVLSQPPFPFEQRWDPQQRGSYKGDRGGKRKKDQRDQAQYYHDDTRASKKPKRRKGKHNYDEEQEYLDTSYEPSYQDDALTSQFGDSTQAERLQSDDMEGEINQQLMNDIHTPTAGFSQGPEDLALPPDDPSILPDLKDGQAKVGMTIAFKQLEMSETTNWQPQISAYRTAIVISITDSGELQLTLAMRDRQQSIKRYDPHTGERIYSRFEVPDGDEMDEDDNKGMLNLLFSNLAEPKIVQEPPPNLGGDLIIEEASQAKELISFETTTLSHEEGAVDEPADEAAEAQSSHVTETPLNSDAPEPDQPEGSMLDAPAEPSVDDTSPANHPNAEPTTPSAEDQLKQSITDVPAGPPADDVPPNDASIIEPNTPSAEAQENHAAVTATLAVQMSEQSRHDWSHLMKEEGGFHSSVPSSITKLIRPGGMRSPDELEKLAQDMSETPLSRPYSPKFNGLGSSPTRKSRNTSKSPGINGREKSSQAPQSSWETVDETVDETASSPPQVIDQPQERPASPPAAAVLEAMQPRSEKKVPVRALPPSKGLQAWQALKQRKRSPTPGSDAETSKASPAPGLSCGLYGADERESIASVRYPELSVGSSFTSQVADHGRQPDFNFEDALELSVDTPTAAGLDYDASHDPQPDVESEAARSAPSNEVPNSNSAEVFMSDSDEPELPPRKLVNTYKSPQRNSPEILEDDLSSDELVLSTIEELASSQIVMKQERGPKKNLAKKDGRYKTAMDALDEDIFEDGQTTPKASQKQRSVLGNRPSKDRNSEKPASQPRASSPRASQPRPSQSQPQASQIVDLTMSSDVEAEADHEPEIEKKFRRPSKRYDDFDNDSYEDDEPKIGRMPKDSRTWGVETRRHTSVGLRSSSQASLNTQNRGKTSAR